MITVTEVSSKILDEWLKLEAIKGVVTSSAGTYHDTASGKFTSKPGGAAGGGGEAGAGGPGVRRRPKSRPRTSKGGASVNPSEGGAAILKYMASGSYPVLDLTQKKTADGYHVDTSYDVVASLLGRNKWDRVNSTKTGNIQASVWHHKTSGEVATLKHDGKNTYFDFKTPRV